jgi:hypothetical protein
MTNLPIVSAATAYDNVVTGKTLILVFNEGIDMRHHMDDTLINLNQCRIHGIQICNDPFDQHRKFGNLRSD